MEKKSICANFFFLIIKSIISAVTLISQNKTTPVKLTICFTRLEFYPSERFNLFLHTVWVTCANC